MGLLSTISYPLRAPYQLYQGLVNGTDPYASSGGSGGGGGSSDTVKWQQENADREAGGAIRNWGAIGLAGGIGLAGLGALISRLRKGRDEEEADKIDNNLQGPVIRVQKKATEDAPRYVEDVGWKDPMSIALATGGVGLGFMAIRKLFDAQRQRELKRRQQEAEQGFDTAVQTALSPQQLRIVSKKASVSDLSDTQLLMAALDYIGTEKSAGMINKLLWWASLPLAATAGLGAFLGYNYSKKNNPYAKELKAIKRRSTLAAMNSPYGPMLAYQPDDVVDGEEVPPKQVSGALAPLAQ